MAYIKKIRTFLGSQKIIHPGARIIIENDHGEVLFIKRKDNGRLGLPAGGLEEDETIEACIRREVKEETGLELLELKLIGISSSPEREFVEYPNGDQVQYFTIEFYSDKWTGSLKADGLEVVDLGFLPKEQKTHLPANEISIFTSLAFYQKYSRPRLD